MNKIKRAEKISMYFNKLQEIDVEIIKIEKLAVNNKSCKLILDFNIVEKNNNSGGSLFPTFIYPSLRTKNNSEEDNDDEEKYSDALVYESKLIDTETLIVIDSLLKIKQAQRNWLIYELKKLEIVL